MDPAREMVSPLRGAAETEGAKPPRRRTWLPKRRIAAERKKVRGIRTV